MASVHTGVRLLSSCQHNPSPWQGRLHSTNLPIGWCVWANGDLSCDVPDSSLLGEMVFWGADIYSAQGSDISSLGIQSICPFSRPSTSVVFGTSGARGARCRAVFQVFE